MNEKKPMSANYALAVTKLCFGGGFVLLMLALAAGSAVAWLVYVLCVPGFIGLFGSLIFAYFKVRCPYCGESLMPGGRMPSRLPDYCPGCGNALDETD